MGGGVTHKHISMNLPMHKSTHAHTKVTLQVTANINSPTMSTTDRNDLVARVFRLRLESIIKDITTEGIFGRVVAHIYVVEFQKRTRL